MLHVQEFDTTIGPHTGTKNILEGRDKGGADRSIIVLAWQCKDLKREIPLAIWKLQHLISS